MSEFHSIKEGHSLAEPLPPSEVVLKKIVSSYPYLKVGYPSSWSVWKDDGSDPLVYVQEICHAAMRYHGPGYDHLVTAVPKKDDLSLKFIRMLLSGPFKAFSDTISLNKFKDDYYLQVDQLDRWPANVLMNFCIVTRTPIEFEGILKYWDELCKQGYPEVLAFLLSASTGGEPFKDYRGMAFNHHFFIDAASDWKNVIHGTPNFGLTKSFKVDTSGITPTNVIWGKSDDHFKLYDMPDDKVVEFFGLKIKEKPRPRPRYGFPPIYKPAMIEPGAFANQIGQLQQAMQGIAPQVAQAPPLNFNEWVNLQWPAEPGAVPQPPNPPELEINLDDDDFQEPDFDFDDDI